MGKLRVMSVPGRGRALGHPQRGRVPGVTADGTWSPHPGGECPRGCNYGVEYDGQATASFFHYKRNFLGLAGLAKVKEGPGGRCVWGIHCAL